MQGTVAAAGPRSALDPRARKAISAACIGNMLEWYDFGVYAFLAGAISAAFFPSGDPTASLLATFAAYGVGFLARPLGGAVIGRLGDRRGRKVALVLTLLMMALGTIGLGLLPTYAQIGIAAPVLLVTLRILQGIAAGGEWGASTAFIIEWAPEGRRGLFGSFQQVSTASGILLGSGVAALLTSLLSPEAMLAWGWRIPFLLGASLLVVGILIRRSVDETPVFEAEVQERKAAAAPSESGPRLGLRAFGFTIFWTVSYYMLLSYMPTFTQKFGALTASQALWSNTIGLVAMVLTVPVFGHLSDRIGRKPLLIASAVAAILLSYPLFRVVADGAGFLTVVAIQVVFGVIVALYSGPGPAAISEIFPSHLRSTWMSIGYTLAVAVFGGFAPFVATWLIAATGSALAPAVAYLIPMAAVTLAVLVRMPETGRARLA
ncbi:MFS transporter [Methylobacterium platani]|uniref:MFS transporter n=2 Tax=Methylobacterium platani TaxID=427683 RepID=A0A179SK07_9HYPH|nr:MFS transporter [Methylobacterium platani]KMO19071.1 major facilitator transporter [Methylobacterium platani JCM 14648]OAS27350.1 MFS transporter [Methylobacterium platani]